MATPAITPSAAPAAAPPAAAAAPATPSTPSPSATPTPAATPTPQSTGTTESGYQDPVARLKSVLTERMSKLNPAELEKGAEQVAAEGGEPEQQDDLSAPATEEDGAATEAAPQAEGEEDYDAEPDPYAPIQPLAAKDLAGRIGEIPELKGVLEQHPELKAQIFQNARAAARAGQYEEVFSSPEEAKVSAEQHGIYANLRDLMTGVNSPETAQSVIQAMLAESVVRDDDGNPVINPKTGKPQTDGTVGRFSKEMFHLQMNVLKGALEAAHAGEGDQDALAAWDLIMERQGLRGPSTAEDDDLPAELRSQRDQINRERQQLQEEKVKQAKAKEQVFNDAVLGSTQTALNAELARIRAKATGLSDFEWNSAVEQIEKELLPAILQNSSYISESDRLKTQGLGEKTKQKFIALNTRYMREKLPRIAVRVLSERNAYTQQQQAAKTATQAARVEASRGETRTALGTTKTSTGLTGAQLQAHVTAEFKAQHGREPEGSEYLQAVSRYRNGLAR